MIKNVEITIHKETIATAERLSLEFGGIAYYYFNKIKKIKSPQFSYIKIYFINKEIGEEFRMSITDKVLAVYFECNFNTYVTLSKKEKISFQQELIYYIFTEIFSDYNFDRNVLDNIKKEIKESHGEMKLICFSKKIKANYKLSLVVYLEIDAFVFFIEILDNKELTKILVIKSKIPTYFIIFYLFRKINFTEGFVKIGGPEHAVFQVDLKEKTVEVLESARSLFEEWSA